MKNSKRVPHRARTRLALVGAFGAVMIGTATASEPELVAGVDAPPAVSTQIAETQIGETDASLAANPPEHPPVALSPILDANAAQIGFQALLTDDSNVPLPGPTVDLTFNLYAVGFALPMETINQPNVPISNGLVSTQVPFSPANFDGTGREIGVSVNADPELTPRIPLSAAAHAFRVHVVESAELTDDVVLGEPGTTGTLTIYNTLADTPAFTANGGTSIFSVYDLNGAGERVRLAARNYGEVDLWDAAGTKTAEMLALAPGALLRMRDASGDSTVELDAEFGQVKAQSLIEVQDDVPSGTPLARMSAFSYGGQLNVWDDEGTLTARLGTSSTSAGGFAQYQTAIGGTGVLVDGEDAGDNAGVIKVQRIVGANVFPSITLDGDAGDGAAEVELYDGFGLRIRMDADGAGGGAGMTLYNSASAETVQIDGDESDAGEIILFDAAGFGGVLAQGSDGNSGRVTVGYGTDASLVLDGNDGNGGSRITMTDGIQNTVFLDARSGAEGGGYLSLSNSAGTGTVEIDADESNHAVLRLSDAGAQDTVRLTSSGAGGGGGISLYNSANTNTVEIDADEGDHAALRIRDASGQISVELEAEFGVIRAGTSGGGVEGDIEVYDVAGAKTFNVNGANGMTTTKALTITGGADLAEPFRVNDTPTLAAQPGMVVSIDAARAGRLKLADQAYDACVAGVISGANALAPGLVMRAEGDPHADGNQNVALTGRVWCWCDADSAPIAPGDRLTTSDVPGHAMKVTHDARAGGTVLGKAMTALPSGRGLVLVLVTLQ